MNDDAADLADGVAVGLVLGQDGIVVSRPGPRLGGSTVFRLPHSPSPLA